MRGAQLQFQLELHQAISVRSGSMEVLEGGIDAGIVGNESFLGSFFATIVA
jgi:hypothetical protein